MRIYPRGGGWYDQDWRDILDFTIIEASIQGKIKRDQKKKPAIVRGDAVPLGGGRRR